jgi:uncharacterized membrane protein YvbJ
MFFSTSNFRDVYRCPKCKAWVGHGDKFCKLCGKEFSEEDVKEMKKVLNSLSVKNYPNLIVTMSLVITILFMIMIFSQMS